MHLSNHSCVSDPADVAFPDLAAVAKGATQHATGRLIFGTVGGAMGWTAGLYFVFSALVAIVQGWPKPQMHHEFAYLLAGQTYASGHVGLPAPPEPGFFETFHELTTPVRAAKYQIGQGTFLALGFRLGHPIIGVWISGALFIAALVWALAAVLPLRWAASGGCLAITLFGGTHYWSQSYWGGFVAALGGALVLGGTLRLGRRPGIAAAFAGGVGVACLIHSRPFEGALFCLVPAVWLTSHAMRTRENQPTGMRRALLWIIPPVAAALGLQAWINASVTGSISQLPCHAYENRYNSAPVFVWQKSKAPREDMPARMLQFDEDVALQAARFPNPVWRHWVARIGQNALFFGGAALSAAVVISLLFRWATEERLAGWMIALCWSSALVTYWYYPHYQAPAAAACLLVGVQAIRTIIQMRTAFSPRTVLTAVVVLHFLGVLCIPSMGRPQEAILDSLNRRSRIADELATQGGRDLVFVSYDRAVSPHVEWVFNEADMEHAAIVWARDLADRNANLIRHFPDRKAWRVLVSPAGAALQPLLVEAAPVATEPADQGEDSTSHD